MSQLDYGYDNLDDLFNFAAQNSGLDPDLLSAVSMAESSHNPSARSPAGAMGLMQLMPKTAADPGIGTGVRPFDPNRPLDDPEENVRFGAEYLAYLLKRYDGNEELALMAYNGGMGTVDRWLRKGKGDPARMEEFFEEETRNYPGRVKAALAKLQQSKGGMTEQGLSDALEQENKPSLLDDKKEETPEDRMARPSSISQLTKPEKKEGPESATQWIKDNLEWAGKALYSGAVDTASLLADMADLGTGPDNGWTDRIAQKLDNHSNEVRQSMPDWIKQQLQQRIITEDENGELDFDMPNLRQVANLIFESAGPSGAIVGGGKLLLKGAGKIKKLGKIVEDSPRLASAVSMGAANSTYVTADTYSSVYDEVKTEAQREGKSLKEATEEAARAASLAAGIIAPLSFVTGGLGEGLASTGATMTKRLAKGLVYGSATEAPEESGQLVAEELGKGKSLSEISRADVLEAGILGALGAGPVEGTMAALFGNDGKVTPGQLDPPPTPEPEPDVPPEASAAEPLNLDQPFQDPGANQPFNPNPEQLDLWGGPPTEELPLMPDTPRATLGVGATGRPGSRRDPAQMALDLPPPPNPAIAAGKATMEAALDHSPQLPNAADALAEPNEEQKKGMFERAQQKLADELELGKKPDSVPQEAVDEENIYRTTGLTIGDETLSSLPNVSSQDVVAIDAKLKDAIPDDEIRQITVEGLLEELNQAREAEPEASVESVLQRVMPTQAAKPQEGMFAKAKKKVQAKKEEKPTADVVPITRAAEKREQERQERIDNIDIMEYDLDPETEELIVEDEETGYDDLLLQGYTPEQAQYHVEEVLKKNGIDWKPFRRKVQLSLVPKSEPAPEPAPEPEPVPDANEMLDEVDAEWTRQVVEDPEGSFQALVEEYGYSEEEAEAEIRQVLDAENLVPANEAEAEYDRERLAKGRMRPVTQPSEGQQQLRVTRTQPAVNEFEDRLAEHVAEKADPGALPEEQVAGVEVMPGDVLDLWHGTTADFDLFQAKTEGLSPGLWFSNNEKTADHYASAEWAGQQDLAGPKRPRKLVVRAVPKNPVTVAWTEEFNDMHLYHQMVNEAKAAGHDMIVFTGIDPAFAGVKGGAGPTGRKSAEKPTQGVAGLDNYYVVLDKNIITHRPGRDTVRLTPEEAARMEADQTAEERAKLDPADRAAFDAEQAAKAEAAELEQYGEAPKQGQLFRKDGKATAAARQPVAKKVTKKKAKKAAAPTAKVADTSVRKTAEEQAADNRFKMQQLVTVRKAQLKILGDTLPAGSTFAASLTPNGLIFNTKQQADAFYQMMKENFQGKNAKMKGKVSDTTMKSMMRVAMKVNKASKAETIPNPLAPEPVAEKPAPKKKATRKKAAKKKATRKKAAKKVAAAPVPETVQTPPPVTEAEETTAAGEPDPTDPPVVTPEERNPDNRPANAKEVKEEEKPAAEAADATLRGIPPQGESKKDNGADSSDADSQAKVDETKAKMAEGDPEQASNPDDRPGDRDASEKVTNQALQEVIRRHSGTWTDLWYYWVANTSFMGLDKKAAKHHKEQNWRDSTARGDVNAMEQYRKELKAWKIRKAKKTKEAKGQSGQVVPFIEPAPRPPSKRSDKQAGPGDFNRDEFMKLFRRAKGRTKLWWMERMTDQHYAIKLVNEILREEGPIHDPVDLYEALTRVGSAVDVKIKKFRGKQQAELEQAAIDAGMTFDELNDFSTVLHSLMRNEYTYNRNIQEGKMSLAKDPDVPGYSGMSENEAKAELAEIEAKHRAAGTLEKLHAVEDKVFAAAQFLRETMANGKLASETQQANWNPDGGGTTTGGLTIHEQYKVLRATQGYEAALDLTNYDLTNIEPKKLDDKLYSFGEESHDGVPYTADEVAKRATLTDKLHNITYVPLSDIQKDTVDEVIRQQLQAKAGANFYSEYDVYGDDIERSYGRQEVGRAKSAVTHLLSHGQQSIIRSDHNIEHAQRIRNMVEAMNDYEFGMALPTMSETYYANPDNVLTQVKIMADAVGIPVPRVTTADIKLLTFHLKEGDQTSPTIIFDLTTANALTNSYTSTATKRVFNAIGNSSSWVRKAMTAWSPPFIGTNFVREVFNAKIQARGIKGLTDTQLKAVQDKATFGESFKWMKTIFTQIKDPNFDPATLPEGSEERAMAETFKQLHEAGMTSEFFHIKSMMELERELRQIESQLGQPTPVGMGKAKEMFKLLGQNLELAAAVSENAVRMAVAAEVLNQTKTAANPQGNVNFAASVGKDLSVNFQRYGTWGSAINSLFFFYNPTVQGLYRAKRALHHKDVRAIVGGAMVFGAMMPLLNRMLAGEDDEGKNYYESVPHWKRSTNFIMMIPGGEGRHITIPLPYVWNLPYALSEKMIDGLTSDSQEAVGEKTKRIAGEMLGLTMENVSPISFSSQDARRTIVPTMAQPFYDVMNNQNWFGSYINPNKNQFSAAPVSDAWNVRDPDKNKKWQMLSQGMAIGGSKYEAGMIDVSPGTLEYLFGYYTGGAGTFFTRVFDTSAAVLTGGGGKSFEENVAAAPLLRRVYGLGDMKSGVRDRYYQLRGDLAAVKLAHKDLTAAKDREGLAALKANEGHLYSSGTMRQFDRVEKQVRKWSTARNRIIKKENKTAQQLKQIELYNKRISDMMKKFNQYYFDHVTSEDF